MADSNFIDYVKSCAVQAKAVPDRVTSTAPSTFPKAVPTVATEVAEAT